ncbi:MAG: tetratricopeptide repeat protein [Ignavibacteria bacterium]|nr:tetratricopeptide repeat protein [Ignavibacteria bacterium]
MEDLSEKARKKMEEGDYETALDLCRQALDFEPTNLDFLHLARKASYNSGNYELAKYFSKRLIIAEPLNAENYYDLGCLELMIFFNYDEAIDNLKKAYELDSGNKEVFYKTGFAYKMKEDYETAKQYYEKLLKGTDNKILLAHTNIELGMISGIEGDFYHLFKYLYKAEQFFPELPDTYIIRAITYKEKLRNHGKALKQLRKALKITKKESYVYYMFADIYYIEQNYEKALKYIEKAIKLNPDDGEYHFLSALIKTELCMFIGDVLSEMTYAVILSEDNDLYRAYRSEAFIITKEYQKALDDINRAIEIKPEKASYYRIRGDIYNGMNKFYDASLDYLKAIQLNKSGADEYTDTALRELYNGCVDKLYSEKQMVISALAGRQVSVN